MSATVLGTALLVLLIVLMTIGSRVSYSVIFVSALGIFLLKGWTPTATFIGGLSISEVGSYTYSALPLFILMGYFTFYAGIADDLFDATKTWVKHINGGLPTATIIASAGFATVSGASTAATSVLGKISIPQMLDAGVKPSMAAGVVAMGGCLAALIPPSTVMVVYGILTEQSISKMLLAGIIPGVLTVSIYIVYIYISSRLDRQKSGSTEQAASWYERVASLRLVLPIASLFLLVIGGIYLGVFTPTEAAGIGALGALSISLVMRRMTWEKLKLSLLDTIKTTCMIFFIMVGISLFSRFLSLAGISQVISGYVINIDVSPITIVVLMLFIYLILGMFMDAVSMMMLTLPIFFPIIKSLGLDPIWYGILVIKMAEIGLVSPPVGLNCFIVKGVATRLKLTEIFKGVMPFILLEILTVVILLLYPSIVTIIL